MYIVVSDDTKKYPDDLSEFPTLNSIVETVGMYFPVNEVHVTTNKNPDAIYASISFLYKDINNYTLRWEGISIRIMRYVHKGNRLHFTMSAKFSKEFPFMDYMDVESYGYDHDKVFLSLVNGVHAEIRRICKSILDGNDELVKGLSKTDRKVVSCFHHREYA